MKRLFNKVVTTVLVCACAIFGLNPQAMAREQEVKFLFPEPFTSAYGYPEGQAVGVFYGSLEYHMQNRPDLKGKYKMRWVGDMYKSPEDILNAVVMGAGQFTYTTPYFIEQFDPEWKALLVPGMFKDMDHFVRAMNTPEWKAKQEKLAKERGFRILKWTNSIGNFYIFTKKGPIKSIDDLKNMKIRFAGQQAYANAFKELGIIGVAMPYTEVTSSMQTNLIDGFLDNIFAKDYYDVPRAAKYVIPASFGVMPQALVVNSKWWDSLPEKEREALEFVIEITDVQKYFDSNESGLFDWWNENPAGEVVNLPPAMLEEWNKRLKKANENYIKDVDPKLIEAIRKTENQ